LDRLDADGIGVFASGVQVFATPLSTGLRFIPRGGEGRRVAGKGAAGIVMRATLHHRAPNTYYGQWLDDSAAFYAGRFAGQCP
jgi:hypothetical protein